MVEELGVKFERVKASLSCTYKVLSHKIEKKSIPETTNGKTVSFGVNTPIHVTTIVG